MTYPGFLYLATLLPEHPGGLFLWYDWDLKGFKKKTWKAFLRDFYISHPSLRNSGFSLNEDGTCIIWLFKFDLQCLAENYPDLEDCFENIGNGLKAISEQRSVFESLLKDADKLAKQDNA